MANRLRQLPLAAKALLPVILIAAIAAGGVVFAMRLLTRTDQTYSAMIDNEARGATEAARLNLLTVDLARATWRATTFRTPEDIRTSRQQVEAMTADYASRRGPVARVVAGQPLAAELATLDRDFAALHQVALRALTMLAEGHADDAMTLLRHDFYSQVAGLREVNRKLTAGLLQLADQRSDAVTAEAAGAAMTGQIGIGLSLLAALLLAAWAMRALVSRPVTRLEEAMRGIAEGRLDTEVPATTRGDELGAMARALQGFATSLAEAARMRAQQEEAKLAAEQERRAGLVRLAGDLEQNLGGIAETVASASTELNAAATSLVSIAERGSSRASEVSAASAEANANVGTVAAATEELAASVAEIARQVNESARVARDAAEQAERTNATVGDLNDASQKIGEVVRLIGDIASQTNLLALNATIEAARAGEAGKGFAVVASEVKTLAAQTAKATDGIAQQIQAMQAATHGAITEISGIRDTILKIGEFTTAIASAVDQQDAATRDIARNVQSAATGTTQIATRIEEVRQAAGETGGAATQVKATSGELSQQAEQLRRQVADVVGNLRAA